MYKRQSLGGAGAGAGAADANANPAAANPFAAMGGMGGMGGGFNPAMM